MTAPTPAGQERADRGEADLIERVARAIYASDHYGFGEMWDDESEPLRQEYRANAAAAVEVLRGEGR